jgi:mannosyltransferase OCH1-like enzyme
MSSLRCSISIARCPGRFIARGGLYVDLDIEALRPANELLDGHSCTLGTEPNVHAERLRGGEQVVCNAAMASEPNHPFWEKMIAEIRDRSTQGSDDPV